MSWPLSQDYNEAIQSPASAFADPDLKRGLAVCGDLGLPMPFSGNFADVYQVRCPDGSRWAVKCFTREAVGLRERYQAISEHLRRAKLPFTVDFTYLEQGIRVAGKWYPVLKMQWVEGLTLNQFAAQNLDKPAMLEALLQIWARMGKHLRAAEIGHCDLQHGNVLLVPGSTPGALALKLIDYDGMWVPALAGKKSGEVGHPNYQHPQRLKDGTYSLEVDRFPLLLVATAMRALKADKGLWAKYDNGDNMLFKESDLASPAASELFQELASLPDPGLVMLAAHVRAALKANQESAPLLEDLIPGSSGSRPALAAKDNGWAHARPAEAVESRYAQETVVPMGARQPSKGRGRLLVALICTAVTLSVGSASAIALTFLRPGVRPNPFAPRTKDAAPMAATGNKPLGMPSDRSPPKINDNPDVKIELRPQPATILRPPPKINDNPDVKFDIQPQPMTIFRSEIVGGQGGEPFEEKGEPGGFVTGFAVKVRGTEIAFLQPIYWAPTGRKVALSGVGHPNDSQTLPNVEGKDSYAIGGLQVWGNRGGAFQLVRGIRILFMRRVGHVLDPKDCYWSDWIGSAGRGQEVMLGGDGNPVIGILGRAGGAIDALGIIQAR